MVTASMRPSCALPLLFGFISLFLDVVSATSPPSSLVTDLSANMTVRSASPYGPVFSTSIVYAHSSAGNYVSNTTTFVPGPTATAFYLRLCAKNISYYWQTGETCTRHVPLPGQCHCESYESSGKCLKWSPVEFQSNIPTSATYGGRSKLNGYVDVDQWEYFYPPFSSTIDVWTVNDSFVTRTVGARVQTDYTQVIPHVPPPGVFVVPGECMR